MYSRSSKRPEVSLENYKNVYDYSEALEPNMLVAKTVHKLVSSVVKPQYCIEPGAQQLIYSNFAAGKKAILIPNHTSMIDPFVLAALAEQVEVFHPLRGTSFIPGRSGVFTEWPLRLFRRPVYDKFVALPTFRHKDSAELGLSTEQATNLVRSASDRLLDVMALRANQGFNIALFPDGQRIAMGGRKQRVRSGVARLAMKLVEPENFWFQPIGMHYSPKRSKRNPSVYVGRPFGIAQTQDQILMDVDASVRQSDERATKLALA